MIIWLLWSTLYILAVFVTARVLAQKAIHREEACVASATTVCTYVCRSLFCVHGHYLPVLTAVVPPLVWLYWLSGVIVKLPELGANRELRRLNAKHELELTKARHAAELAQVRASENEAIDRQLMQAGHTNL